MKPPLSELLRPTELADLFQPNNLVRSLEKMVEQKRIQNMIFYGLPGIGKTSACRILLQKLDCDSIEINGSLSTGIEVIRDRIEPFSSCVSFWGKPKAVLIEEADYLSRNAQASLKRTIEKFHYVHFLMTTNDLGKIAPAIQSRCLPVSFDIPRASVNPTIERLVPRYTQRLEQAGYRVEASHLLMTLRKWFPDMRGVANELEFRRPA